MFSVTINLNTSNFPPTDHPIDVDRTLEAIGERLDRGFHADFTIDMREDRRAGISVELSDPRNENERTAEWAEELKQDVESLLAKIPPVLCRSAASPPRHPFAGSIG